MEWSDNPFSSKIQYQVDFLAPRPRQMAKNNIMYDFFLIVRRHDDLFTTDSSAIKVVQRLAKPVCM